MRSWFGSFLAAVNIALAIIVIAWLHSPPFDYQGPAEQSKQGARAKQQPGQPEANASKPVAPVNGTPTSNLQTQHRPDPTGSDEKPEKGWWDKIWTDPNATFSGTVALFTLALVIVGAWQGIQLKRTVVATRNSVNTARAEFISTNRPRVFVRDVFCPFVGVDGTPIEVAFTVVNGGSSPAHIEHSTMAVEIFQTWTLMLVPTAMGGNDLISATTPDGKVTLIAGESKKFTHIAAVVAWSAGAKQSWDDDRLGLFFSGHIIYTDDNGTSRHTAFRRRYDPVRQRFYPIDDQEHEYAD